RIRFMKRLMMTSLVAAGLLFTMTEASYAQLAKQNLTMQQIQSSLNELVNKGDAASKAQLVKEAKAFAASKNETYHRMAVSIYRQLGDEKAAEKVQKDILKKFPNGATARST